MIIPNELLIKQAKASLNGKWFLAIGGYLAYLAVAESYTIIPNASIKMFGNIVVLLLTGPFTLGLTAFFISIARDEETKLEQIFIGFKSFGKALGTYLLMVLYIILWMLLLIVPGIIAAFSYSMTFYVLSDNPTISAVEALKKSKELMVGFKWKYCKFILRFVWIPIVALVVLYLILAATVFHGNAKLLNELYKENSKYILPIISVLFSWLAVWFYVGAAKFYDDIKDKTEIEEVIFVDGVEYRKTTH